MTVARTLTSDDVKYLVNELNVEKIHSVQCILKAFQEFDASPDLESKCLIKLLKLLFLLFRDEKIPNVDDDDHGTQVTNLPIIEHGSISEELKQIGNIHQIYSALVHVYKRRPRERRLIERLCQIRKSESEAFFTNVLIQTNIGEFRPIKPALEFEALIRVGLNAHSPLTLMSLHSGGVSSFKMTNITREISDASSLLIDGYSLIMQCLFGHQVDIAAGGGSSLHLVYLFERYIQIFSHLSKYYWLVFFQDMQTFLFNDPSLRLASSVILKHATNNNQLIKDRTQFFANFYSQDYADFLNREKPTFIVFNELDQLRKLKLSQSSRVKVSSMCSINHLRHLNSSVKIVLINEMTINSNRLNAFYTSNINRTSIDNLHKLLVDLNYAAEIDELKRSMDVSLGQEANSDATVLSAIPADHLTQLKSQVGDRLALYCIALLHCHARLPEFDDFRLLILIKGIFHFNLIFLIYFLNES
jgi:hypothetical protein